MRRFIVFAFLLFWVGGCNRAPDASKASTQVAAKSSFPNDDLGREIKLKAPAQRVAVIGPGTVEMIFVLGADEKLVGRDEYSDYPSEAKKIPVIGNYQGPAIEKTLAARPDLVIVTGESYGAARLDDWQKKLNVPVAGLAATDVYQLSQGVRKIGRWLGVEADALAKSIDTGDSGETTGDRKAFIEIGRKPLWTTGADTLVGDIVQRSGYQNVADIKGYKQFNLENLLALQPDVYIATSNKMRSEDDVVKFSASEHKRVLNELRREPGIKNLKCVQKGDIIVVPNDWLLRPGPRVVNAIAFLAEQHRKLNQQQ
jgi:iron complex transport system substrate-binding protein